MKNKKAITLSCKTFCSDFWSALLRSRKTMSTQTKLHSYGFTLSEATTVLIILGIIAVLTIPSLINRQKEIADRAKIKKAWEIYDSVISTMRADHPMMSKEAFTAWANQPNCPNTVSYFKTVNVDANNGCVFKTPDGVWFDISDVMHPTITLDGNNNKTDDNTFTFVVSYDPNNLTFSVNNPMFPDLTSDEKADLKKLFSKLDENVSIGESKWVNNFYSSCSSWGCSYDRYDYDSNGNMIAHYISCDVSGNNCMGSNKYEYDSSGNQIAHYYGCDGSGNICNGSNKYEYDSSGNQIAHYYDCDGSGNICNDSFKSDYDSNGKMIANYYCDGSGNNCNGSNKYEYDSSGNQIAHYYGCDGSGNICYSSTKYDYDSNGNKIAEYYCDGSGNNCNGSDKFNYDSNGNKVAEYQGCDGSGNNCDFTYNYSYIEIK